MPPMRSTALKLVAKTCLRALDFSEAGAPYDRTVFQAGIAAHAVCQVAGESARAGSTTDLRVLADRVVRELVTVGRGFDGVMEPPMPVQDAVQGRDLAIPWLEMYPPSPGARYEHGLAVDREWNPVAYNDPRAYYRAALDVFERIDDVDEEGYPEVTIIVDDYKSAPPTDATELDTVQIRGQLAVALAHHPDARIGRRAVTNLWRRKRYTSDLLLDDDGRFQVDQWRRDIDHAIAATEVRGADGRRPANPGAGCMGCPWVTRCDAAREVFRGSIVANDLADRSARPTLDRREGDRGCPRRDGTGSRPGRADPVARWSGRGVRADDGEGREALGGSRDRPALAEAGGAGRCDRAPVRVEARSRQRERGARPTRAVQGGQGVQGEARGVG